MSVAVRLRRLVRDQGFEAVEVHRPEGLLLAPQCRSSPRPSGKRLRPEYLEPPAGASALAGKIVYLARQPAEARRLGSTARRRVLERFTLAHCTAAHDAVLREPVPRYSRAYLQRCRRGSVLPAPSPARRRGGRWESGDSRRERPANPIGEAGLLVNRYEPRALGEVWLGIRRWIDHSVFRTRAYGTFSGQSLRRRGEST